MKYRAQTALREDWVNLIIGAWIFIMPWAVTHTLPMASAPVWNFWIVGAIIFIVSATALRGAQVWQEWTNLVAGVWLLLSPWIFGYVEQTTLLWNSLLGGLIVAVIAGVGLTRSKDVATTTQPVSTRKRRDRDRAA